MATESDHISLANKNHDALMHLMQAPDEHPEWITTVAFYKALQIVEAAFSNHPTAKNCTSHPGRLEALKTVSEFKKIFPHYRALYAASTVARYLHDNISKVGYSTFEDFLPTSKVVSKMVYGRLRPIEELSMALLSGTAKANLKRLDSRKPRA